MKIWLDPTKEAPEGYAWCKSCNDIIRLLEKTQLAYFQDELVNSAYNSAEDASKREYAKQMMLHNFIEIIDMSHDAAEMRSDGGQYINFLYWLEEVGARFPVKIHIHSDHPRNPIGVQEIRNLIKRNGWTEVSCTTCKYKSYDDCDEICARCEDYNGWTKEE